MRPHTKRTKKMNNKPKNHKIICKKFGLKSKIESPEILGRIRKTHKYPLGEVKEVIFSDNKILILAKFDSDKYWKIHEVRYREPILKEFIWGILRKMKKPKYMIKFFVATIAEYLK